MRCRELIYLAGRAGEIVSRRVCQSIPVTCLVSGYRARLVGNGVRGAFRARPGGRRIRQVLRYGSACPGSVRTPAAVALFGSSCSGPIVNSVGYDLNRIFNELPIVAFILALADAGGLLLQSLVRSNDQPLAAAIILL